MGHQGKKYHHFCYSVLNLNSTMKIRFFSWKILSLNNFWLTSGIHDPVKPKSPLALSLFITLTMPEGLGIGKRAPPWTATSCRRNTSSPSSSWSSRTSTTNDFCFSSCLYVRYPDTLRRSVLAGWLWSSWISERLSRLVYSRRSCIRPVKRCSPSGLEPILMGATSG